MLQLDSLGLKERVYLMHILRLPLVATFGYVVDPIPRLEERTAARPRIRRFGPLWNSASGGAPFPEGRSPLWKPVSGVASFPREGGRTTAPPRAEDFDPSRRRLAPGLAALLMAAFCGGWPSRARALPEECTNGEMERRAYLGIDPFDGQCAVVRPRGPPRYPVIID